MQDSLNISDIFENIDRFIKFYQKIGFKGFDLSQNSLDIISQWGKNDTIDLIKADITDCKRCKLSETRNQIIFGFGDPNASIIFIEDSPSFETDKTGNIFEGEAGKLLHKIIEAIKIKPESIYISHLIKCHTPNNREPLIEEITACLPFLVRQLKIIKSNFICAFGGITAKTLLGLNEPVETLRKRFHEYMGKKIIVTYPPYLLLNHKEKKREVWDDMQMLMRAFKND